jgi:hypothetical protein
MSRITLHFNASNVGTLKDSMADLVVKLSSPSAMGALVYVDFATYTQAIRNTIEKAFPSNFRVLFSENPRQTEVRITPIQ